MDDLPSAMIPDPRLRLLSSDMAHLGCAPQGADSPWSSRRNGFFFAITIVWEDRSRVIAGLEQQPKVGPKFSFQPFFNTRFLLLWCVACSACSLASVILEVAQESLGVDVAASQGRGPFCMEYTSPSVLFSSLRANRDRDVGISSVSDSMRGCVQCG